jgi:hypothetical protein
MSVISESNNIVNNIVAQEAYLQELEAKIAAAEAKLKTMKETTSTEKFVGSLMRAHKMGRLSCDNPRHGIVCAWDRAKNSCACHLRSKQTEHRRDLRFILSEMVPFKEAQCKCERDALEEGIKWNYPGMPATKWVAVGARHVGVDNKESSKRVMPVGYSLTKQQHTTLQNRFPSWFFYHDSILNHDHPLSHTCAKMASHHIMNDAIPRGTVETPTTVIDINGNPASNEARMKRDPTIKIHTVCKRHTPKDELRRAMKWGDKFDSEGNVRWHELWDREIGAEGSTLTPQTLQDAHCTVMMHVLYYYSPAEIEKYLARCSRDHVIYATVHKHEGMSGELNGGEQVWTRTRVGGRDLITQTNVIGKEQYQHAPLDWVFGASSANVTRTHGLTWDVNLICEDTYQIRLKRFDRSTIGNCAPPAPGPYCASCAHCEASLPPTPSSIDDKDDRRDQCAPNGAEWLSRYKTAIINTGAGFMEVPIAPKTIGILNEMRVKMEGKRRVMEEYQSMLSLLKVKVKAHETKTGTVVEYEEFRNLAQACFWMDALSSTSSDNRLWEDTYNMSFDSSLLYTRGGHARKKAFVDAAIEVAQSKSIQHASLAALLQARRYVK